MRRLMILGVLAVGLVACGEAAEPEGRDEVYAQIAAESDCTALQAGFDQAMDNAEAREPGDPLRRVSLDYANAYHERLAEAGCY